jgi:hypothetical protein
MYMVRFDSGTETWATQLTDSSPSDPPYRTEDAGAPRAVQFVWAHSAYPHRGRLAYDGENWAAYYGVSISLWESCVDPERRAEGVNIHQGDRFTVVDADGGRLDDQSSGFGCSHSFWQRIVWDPMASRFMAVCMTDNSNRLSLGGTMAYATILPFVELWQVTVGGLVVAPDGGYWMTFSDAEAAGSESGDVFLFRFSMDGNSPTLEETISLAAETGVNELAPYLAPYGNDGLVAGWSTADTTSGSARYLDNRERQLHIQARDRATGAAIGDPVAVDVSTNTYQDFRAFPDGSVAYSAQGDSNTTVKILRVLPCDE